MLQRDIHGVRRFVDALIRTSGEDDVGDVGYLRKPGDGLAGRRVLLKGRGHLPALKGSGTVGARDDGV